MQHQSDCRTACGRPETKQLTIWGLTKCSNCGNQGVETTDTQLGEPCWGRVECRPNWESPCNVTSPNVTEGKHTTTERKTNKPTEKITIPWALHVHGNGREWAGMGGTRGLSWVTCALYPSIIIAEMLNSTVAFLIFGDMQGLRAQRHC